MISENVLKTAFYIMLIVAILLSAGTFLLTLYLSRLLNCLNVMI